MLQTSAWMLRKDVANQCLDVARSLDVPDFVRSVSHSPLLYTEDVTFLPRKCRMKL